MMLRHKPVPLLKGILKQKEILAPHTSWHIGGPAEYYVLPQTIEDLQALIRYANDTDMPLHVLGRGSNVLIDDAGLLGITIHMQRSFQTVRITEDTLIVGAGVSLPKVAKLMSEKGYAGFEFLAGIPGTVGAAVLINAGAGGEDVRMWLKAVTMLNREGQLHHVEAADMHLSYRNSLFLYKPIIVVEVEFHLGERDDRGKAKEKLRDILARRRTKFPLKYPNAGSTFKRPQDGTGPFTGYLLETAGMKGYRIGDAQVSELHANFVVNLGNATADDVRRLIDVMQERVFKVHGISLEREVIYLPQEFRW